MLEFPSEWVQHFGVHLATAFPPDLGARFRYHERIRPQPSFAQLVERLLASDPDFKPHQVGEMVRIVTGEGEYGAWVRIDGRRDGAPAVRFIGAVFLDEFAAALECIALQPHHFAALEQQSLDLLRATRFEMADRPRRFFYVPPVGWQGIPSGQTANWYPPDFPNNLTNIVVPPALVIRSGAERVIEDAFAQLGAGLTVTSDARDEIVSSTGIKGHALRLQGQREGRDEPLFRELAMFVVDRHAYRMRLETAAGDRLLELREVFRGVVGSFRPLPSSAELRMGRAFAGHPTFFDHWAS